MVLRSVVAVALLTAVLVAQPTVGAKPAQWRVVWTESPQTTATIAWSTGVDVEGHAVHFDIESRSDTGFDYAFSKAASRSREYSGGNEYFYHHVVLEDLRPNTTYYFVMVSGEETSRELFFRTAPDEAIPVTILSGGDSRSDPVKRREMNLRMARLAATNDEVLAFAHGGDYVLNGLSLDQWSQWLSDHELATTEQGRVLPIIPTRGNHEAVGALYDEVFGSPGGGFGKNYFATRVTPDVLLVTLNTEVAAGGAQAEFLRRAFENNLDARWRIVQYHRAIWPAVKQPARAKPHWQPLFEEFGVDVALESDGHVLKRTVPLRNDQEDPTGVIYVGEGGLGVKQRTPAARWYLDGEGHAESAHHVWLLRFGPESLAMRAVDERGATRDEIVLTPKR